MRFQYMRRSALIGVVVVAPFVLTATPVHGLEVMSQLWATRDYAMAPEKILVEKGIIDNGELDSLEWNSHEQAVNQARREAFLKDAFWAINADFTTLEKRNRQIDNFNESELGS